MLPPVIPQSLSISCSLGICKAQKLNNIYVVHSFGHEQFNKTIWEGICKWLGTVHSYKVQDILPCTQRCRPVNTSWYTVQGVACNT